MTKYTVLFWQFFVDFFVNERCNKYYSKAHKHSLLEKCPIFGIIQVRIFPHSNWIRTSPHSVTPHLSVFSLNAGKQGPKLLRIRTLLRREWQTSLKFSLLSYKQIDCDIWRFCWITCIFCQLISLHYSGLGNEEDISSQNFVSNNTRI